MSYTEIFQSVLKASRALPLVKVEQINRVLLQVADAAEENIQKILDANIRDLSRMDISDPKYDRLLLNESRIKAIADDIRNVVQLESPLGRILKEKTLNN